MPDDFEIFPLLDDDDIEPIWTKEDDKALLREIEHLSGRVKRITEPDKDAD